MSGFRYIGRGLLERLSAVGADFFSTGDDETTTAARVWLHITQGGAACDAAGFADRIGGVTIFTDHTTKSFGKLLVGTCLVGDRIDDLPDILGELQIFDILGDIVQPPQQVERISQCKQGGDTQTGGGSKQCLIAYLDIYSVFKGFHLNTESGLSSGDGLCMGGDLNNQFIAGPVLLNTKITAVEIGDQSAGDICRGKLSVIDALFHTIDYNREVKFLNDFRSDYAKILA